MKVLVACEHTGTVREAFAKRGHDAWSCDLLDTEIPGQHIKGDVLDVLDGDWDLMIAHPSCTYLTNSGVRWLHSDEGRWELMREAAQFFRRFLDAKAPRKAVENPIMHKYAVEIIGRRQDQVVQPWMFGHKQMKATGLWLVNLPLLQPTNIMRPPKCPEERKSWQAVFRAPPGPDRWKFRSRTFQGIADAFADQWGGLLI